MAKWWLKSFGRKLLVLTALCVPSGLYTAYEVHQVERAIDEPAPTLKAPGNISHVDAAKAIEVYKLHERIQPGWLLDVTAEDKVKGSDPLLQFLAEDTAERRNFRLFAQSYAEGSVPEKEKWSGGDIAKKRVGEYGKILADRSGDKHFRDKMDADFEKLKDEKDISIIDEFIEHARDHVYKSPADQSHQKEVIDHARRIKLKRAQAMLIAKCEKGNDLYMEFIRTPGKLSEIKAKEIKDLAANLQRHIYELDAHKEADMTELKTKIAAFQTTWKARAKLVERLENLKKASTTRIELRDAEPVLKDCFSLSDGKAEEEKKCLDLWGIELAAGYAHDFLAKGNDKLVLDSNVLVKVDGVMEEKEWPRGKVLIGWKNNDPDTFLHNVNPSKTAATHDSITEFNLTEKAVTDNPNIKEIQIRGTATGNESIFSNHIWRGSVMPTNMSLLVWEYARGLEQLEKKYTEGKFDQYLKTIIALRSRFKENKDLDKLKSDPMSSWHRLEVLAKEVEKWKNPSEGKP